MIGAAWALVVAGILCLFLGFSIQAAIRSKLKAMKEVIAAIPENVRDVINSNEQGTMFLGIGLFTLVGGAVLFMVASVVA